MTYMDPRPGGLNTEKAPESIVETLKMPDNKTVTFDASQWQLVPLNPTNAQLTAISEADSFNPYALYAAMLAAAPAPAAQSAGQEAVARILTWKGEGSQPLSTIAARTYAEYSIEDARNSGCWEEGTKLYAAPVNASVPVGETALRSRWNRITNSEDMFEQFVAEVRALIAAPVNGGERELGQVIDERDQYHDAADKLAGAIAKHFGVEIGEHSNLNCPWQNALDHIAQATKHAADAQQVGGRSLVWDDACVVLKGWLDKSGASFDDQCQLFRELAALTSPAKEQK